MTAQLGCWTESSQRLCTTRPHRSSRTWRITPAKRWETVTNIDEIMIFSILPFLNCFHKNSSVYVKGWKGCQRRTQQWSGLRSNGIQVSIVGSWFLLILTTLLNIGGSKGGGARDAPPGVQILSFSCSFWQKIDKIIAFRELAPPPGENPGSATVVGENKI